MKAEQIKKKSARYLNGVWELTKRNILLFMKNRATVFFSLLAPILIFILYTLFMGDMMLGTIKNSLPENIVVSDKIMKGVFNAWMVSGVIGIACLTVSLNSLLVVISDKEGKALNDFNASPISRVNLLLSYFIASAIITFTLCFIVLLFMVVYLLITSDIKISFADFMELMLILLLSVLSAVIIMMCIVSLIKTNAAVTAFSGVFSALIGFLTGAYLPSNILPLGIQNFANLIPGSHSNGLFRSVLLGKAVESLPDSVPAEFINEITKTYSFSLKLFGAELNTTFMYLFLTGSIIVFFAGYLIAGWISRKIKHKISKQ